MSALRDAIAAIPHHPPDMYRDAVLAIVERHEASRIHITVNPDGAVKGSFGSGVPMAEVIEALNPVISHICAGMESPLGSDPSDDRPALQAYIEAYQDVPYTDNVCVNRWMKAVHLVLLESAGIAVDERLMR